MSPFNYKRKGIVMKSNKLMRMLFLINCVYNNNSNRAAEFVWMNKDKSIEDIIEHLEGAVDAMVSSAEE